MAKAKSGDKRKENQFWKMRSKHGRDKLFETPELLWEACAEYFQWVDDNPWESVTPVKAGDKFGQHVITPTARPYTMKALCIYLGCNSAYFRQFKASLPEGEEDFSTVISLIEDVIYTQKFEGAVVGAFNANIISRDLGLIDKSSVDNSGVIRVIKLEPGQAKEISDELEDEC